MVRWAVKALLWLVCLSAAQVAVLRYVNPPCTATTAWEWIGGGGKAPQPGPRASWRDLDAVSPHLGRAVLAGEDQRFLTHHGFDFVEMNAALADALSRGELRGASTISMQAARTVFLWPGRTVIRKALEAYYTVLMELFWGKPRILEVYLNTVDWGTGVMGAEQAARTYFHVSAARLSRDQAALLAAVLPNPHRWSPAAPDGTVCARRDRILRHMGAMPLIR